MDKSKQSEILGKCLFLVDSSGVCPETTIKEWPNLILFAHSHGYLYTNQLNSVFICAYRIKEWSEDYSKIMPSIECGDKLYVAWAVSYPKTQFSLLKMLRQYVINNPDIIELIYYSRNSDHNLHRINLRRNYGKEKSSVYSVGSLIPV